MDPLQKRFMLFLLGCIPTRLALVVMAIVLPLGFLKWFAVFALMVGIGFWTIFLTGKRKVGAETMGSPIWWNLLRPVHGMLWLLIAYYSWTMRRDLVWRLLLVDVCLGLVSFLIFHGFLSKNKM